MNKTLLPYSEVPQLSKSDIAYVTQDTRLKPFYQYAPRLDAFEEILLNKERSEYPRADLVAVLRDQYRTLPETAAVQSNIEALLGDDTFTITTAHQPSVFLGPLYFLYKALATINLAEAVQAKTKNRRIVPVFVLGSEDHDLAELNTIHLFGKKLTWDSPETGSVGSMKTASLAPVLAELKGLLGESETAQRLFDRVERAYTLAPTLADATRAMLHDLFGRYGLVVLDMNDARLKRHFVPIMKAELLEQASFKIVQQTIAELNAAGFKTQAAPRQINLFYMKAGLRERIVLDTPTLPQARYKVLNIQLEFTEAEILAELEAHPEHFSPNVLLRPLFQETILPNMAYVGGGGELAYWLERQAQFRYFGVQYPMLVRRNSVLWLDREAGKKLSKFGFTSTQFFGDTDALVRDFIEKNASGEVSLELEINDLKKIFDRIAAKATAVDPTLEKAARADEVKAVGSLEQWQGRLVRAEKQKHEVVINQIRAGKEKFFPNGGLQERTDNFMPYVLKYGDAFIEELKSQLQPFEEGFVILEETF